MRILALNQLHRRPGGSGSARVNELVQAWSARGHEVRVLAGTVDHATGRVAPSYADRWLTREAQDGGTVVRTWTLGASKATTTGRLARDLSYTCTAVLAGSLGRWRPDVVVGSSPPLTTVAAAAALAKLWSVPLVFDLRDLWPDYAVEFGALRGPPARAAFKLEDWLYRSSERIIAVTPSFVEPLSAKGVPASKIAVIPNGVNLDEFFPGPQHRDVRARLGWGDKFVVCYAGVHGPAQGLEQAVAAAEMLRQHEDILVAFVGEGEERTKLERLSREKGLENVRFHGEVAREEIPSILRAADVGLALLRRLPTFQHVYPAKIFEILGCGRPIVLAAEGASARLVEKADAGLVVPPEQPEALASALLALRNDPAARSRFGANGRAFVEAHFDRRKLADEYARILEEVIA